MSNTEAVPLSGVAETLITTLNIRAIESQRPDALVKDERAEAIVLQMDQSTLWKTLALTGECTRVAVIRKGREFGRFVSDFMARHSDAVVVHIGCGLDTRFERLNNTQVEWHDLDLPEVIDLRRKLVGGEGIRRHFLSGSVLDSTWLDTISVHEKRPFLFLAEGVSLYFEEALVKSLVLRRKERFPGSELVFDAFSPFMRWAYNVKVSASGSARPCIGASGAGKSSRNGRAVSASLAALSRSRTLNHACRRQ